MFLCSLGKVSFQVKSQAKMGKKAFQILANNYRNELILICFPVYIFSNFAFFCYPQGKKKTHLQREKMKAKQKQAPVSTKTWIKNVPEQKMKLTSEHTLSALKLKKETVTSFSHDHKSFVGNVQQKLLRG